MLSIAGILKRLAARLPRFMQQSIKKVYFKLLIYMNRFYSNEFEFDVICNFVAKGDWVIDIGANIGHYTLKLSKLVGTNGRVIAFEPIPDTFEILTNNVSTLLHCNVTLLNFAVSDTPQEVSMSMPTSESGLTNFYQAHISNSGDTKVLAIRIDDISIINPIKLIKIDAEGHEFSVLRGMADLISRDKPILIVEEPNQDLIVYLKRFGYGDYKKAYSPNRIFVPDSISDAILSLIEKLYTNISI